ncbi:MULTISPECIES: hypothetical protein [Streptomyces]|uniref:DUF6881 domain-containing protein n=2 Tax=Streptomyces TaxID=1883 RepID=A0ABV9IJ78_9ACTN
MLHIDPSAIPDYFERWPKQGNGEMHELTKFLGFSTMTVELRQITEENIDEWLYRLDVFYSLYGLLTIDGTERKVSREELEGHIGLKINAGEMDRAEFDEKIAELRYYREHNRPRPLFVHLRRTSLHRLDQPCDIYQYVHRKDGEEQQRVEVYPDGRLLWVEGNYDGTGEIDWDYATFRGLEAHNARPGWEAEFVEEEMFQRLWERARADLCGWVEELKGTKEWSTIDETESVYCTQPRNDAGSAFCVEHYEMARRMFPRLFPAT